MDIAKALLISKDTDKTRLLDHFHSIGMRKQNNSIYAGSSYIVIYLKSPLYLFMVNSRNPNHGFVRVGSDLTNQLMLLPTPEAVAAFLSVL